MPPRNIAPLHRCQILPFGPVADAPGEHPDLIEQLRKRAVPCRPTLRDDWRDLINEIRWSPVSHLIVAIAAITFWTVLLVAPLMLAR